MFIIFFNPTAIIIAAIIIILVMLAGVMEIIVFLSVIAYIILEIMFTLSTYEYVILPSYKYSTLIIRIVTWSISILIFFSQIVEYYHQNSIGGLLIGALIALFGIYAWLFIICLYYKIESKYLESKSYNAIVDILLSLIIPIIVGMLMVGTVHSLLS